MASNEQKILSLNDLANVLTELHTARAKWYNLGLQLKVSVTDLQRIESEYKNDHGTCLRQMLVRWLETGSATWEALIEALQAPIVHGGENQTSTLAETLQMKYCEGGEKQSKSKGKKRKISEMQSSSQAPAGGAPPSTKRPRGDLPDTLDPEDFVNTPSEDRRCVKCHQVPTNPQLSGCCNTTYCQPCSKTKTYCITHHCIISYTDNKQLRSKILNLQLRCPNWRGGCQYKEGVSKVYRQHLPECQIHVQVPGGSSGAPGRPTGTATPLTISPSPAIKIEPTVSTMTATPTASYSQSSVGGSKSVASSKFGGTPTSSKFESKPTKVKVKPMTQQINCRYHRIGCLGVFQSYQKMEQHLLEDVQKHLDLAITKIEQLMDTLHQP